MLTKTLTILAASLIIVSCSDDNDKNIAQKPPRKTITIIDTVIAKPLAQENGLDSALYYFEKEMNCGIKRDNCEIKYLRTGIDWYRVKGNKYADSVHYYCKKLQALVHKK